ncbi:MAG: PilW family protein [Pseudomonadota bacterium]
MKKLKPTGFTLVELLIALGISVAIIGTIAQALALTSEGYRRAQTLSAMQEQADVALRFLANDVRMAGHWSLAGSARYIVGRSLPGNQNPSGLQLPRRCDPKFVLDLTISLGISKSPEPWGCRVDAAPNADALVLRGLGAAHATPLPPRLQVVAAPGHGAVSVDEQQLPDATGPIQRHNLTVYGYYVAQQSSLFPDQPVLRRLTLSALSSRPYIVDEEIAHGIETVRFAALVDEDGDGHADRTRHPADPELARRDGDGSPLVRVLGVQIWLVVRSDTRGWEQEAPTTFQLGDETFSPPSDGHLRFVTQHTAWVRNAGGLL